MESYSIEIKSNLSWSWAPSFLDDMNSCDVIYAILVVYEA